MKKLIILLLAGLIVTNSAWALTLSEAKQQGLVGEQQNGLLGIVKSSPEVEKLTKEVNAKRKAAYKKIAKENKLSKEQMAELAGKKAINKTPKGQYIQDKNGKWVKK